MSDAERSPIAVSLKIRNAVGQGHPLADELGPEFPEWLGSIAMFSKRMACALLGQDFFRAMIPPKSSAPRAQSHRLR